MTLPEAAISDTEPSFLTLPDRTRKPRVTGLTHVLDKGLPLLMLEGLLDMAGAHMDYVKLGWGTAYVARGVREKVALCRDHGTTLCLGGTLLEIAAHQGQVDAYASWVEGLGIDHVEVSNGALCMPTEEKQALVALMSERFAVVSEVGSKQAGRRAVGARWAEEMRGDLEAGARMVIAEGRESGTVGLFEDSGAVRADLVDDLLSSVAAERIIFEAPRKDQQSWFLHRVGTSANLGNIAPEDVLSLETLRRGLRADSLDLLPTS